MQRETLTPRQDDLLGDQHGGSVYLRLSTRKIAQVERQMTEPMASSVLQGGYWLCEPEQGADLAIIYSGAISPEAIEAHATLSRSHPGCGLLAVTSGDRLFRGWRSARRMRDTRSPIEQLLQPLSPTAKLVTVIDAHPATLSWIGGVRGQRICPLGVEHFGQSGSISDLYRLYGIDAEAIVAAARDH